MSSYQERIDANIVLSGITILHSGHRYYYRLPRGEGNGSYGFNSEAWAKVAALHALGVNLGCDRWEHDLRTIGLVW